MMSCGSESCACKSKESTAGDAVCCRQRSAGGASGGGAEHPAEEVQCSKIFKISYQSSVLWFHCRLCSEVCLYKMSH